MLAFSLSRDGFFEFEVRFAELCGIPFALAPYSGLQMYAENDMKRIFNATNVKTESKLFTKDNND